MASGQRYGHCTSGLWFGSTNQITGKGLADETEGLFILNCKQRTPSALSCAVSRRAVIGGFAGLPVTALTRRRRCAAAVICNAHFVRLRETVGRAATWRPAVTLWTESGAAALTTKRGLREWHGPAHRTTPHVIHWVVWHADHRGGWQGALGPTGVTSWPRVWVAVQERTSRGHGKKSLERRTVRAHVIKASQYLNDCPSPKSVRLDKDPVLVSPVLSTVNAETTDRMGPSALEAVMVHRAVRVGGMLVDGV